MIQYKYKSVFFATKKLEKLQYEYNSVFIVAKKL